MKKINKFLLKCFKHSFPTIIMLLLINIIFCLSPANAESRINLDKTNLLVLNVPENTSAIILSNEIEKLGIVGNFYDSKGTLFNDKDIIKSGSIFKSGLRTYTIIVTGDVFPDGIIDSSDYLQIKSYLRGTYSLSDIGFKSADVNKDAQIDSTDYLNIKAHFLKIKILEEPLEDTDSSQETSSEISDQYSEDSSELTSEDVNSSDDSSQELKTYYAVYNVVDDDMGYISGNTFQTVEEGSSCTTICACPNMYYEFVSWNDGVTTPQRTDVITGNRIYTAYFKYVGLPTIKINYNGTLTKEAYNIGNVSVENCPSDYAFSSKSMQIKGRGNASWNFEKKSYKIKFDSKINLLGIGEKARKDWVLISNHCDKSLMRNYFGYSLAGKLDGIDADLGVMQAHVYVNNAYMGVYLITEEVEVNKGRVDIDTDGTQEDIGFLLELDNYYSGTENVDYICVNGLYYTIKSDYTSASQVQYIKKFITSCDNAIRSGNQQKIELYLDMDSLIDIYILQEFVKNIDVGWSSFYMYSDKGENKLHFGPIWDLDLAMGNDYRLDNGSYQGIYAGKDYYMAQTNQWFVALAKQSWFRDAVNIRWGEIKQVIYDEIKSTEKFIATHREELSKNFSKWKIYNTRINLEPDALLRFTSYDQNTEHLIDWLENRYYWLDSYFATWVYKKP